MTRKFQLDDNALAGLTEEFRRRFGRDPLPDDPLFWSDRSGDTPIAITAQEIEEVVWAAMDRAGFDPTKVPLNRNSRLKSG